MHIVPVWFEDLQTILDIQFLAFQKEGDEFHDYQIEPLTQTLDDLRREFQSLFI